MSLSFSKWKNILTGSHNADSMHNTNKKSKHATSANEKLEPEVGFKMILDPNGSSLKNSLNAADKNLTNVPELNVHIIGARHLPSLFGLKTVEGYIIKVKLFPGSTRFDTTIQTNSWPKFNETFKFPLAPALKSSIRSRSKEDCLARTPPEKLFKGHFVVLTVFALLELPPGTLNPIKETYQSFKRKGSILLKEKKIIKGGKSDKADTALEEPEEEKSVFNLTKSESRRNIGSMTCYLNPKMFVENTRTGHYCTDEMWLPVKDITISGNTNSTQLSSSSKGQIEVSLQICDEDNDTTTSQHHNGKSTNPFEEASNDDSTQKHSFSTKSLKTRNETDIMALNYPEGSTNRESYSNGINNGNTSVNGENSTMLNRTESLPTRRSSRWSLGEVKKKIKGKDKQMQMKTNTFLKFNILRMRCSIRVKEEFENIAGNEIYLKATVFERGILSATWKSKVFAPSLSMRWDKEKDAHIKIPLVNEHDIEYISIKISVATKERVGKKIFLGTLHLGHDSTGERLDHWEEMISSRGLAVTKWHNFE